MGFVTKYESYKLTREKKLTEKCEVHIFMGVIHLDVECTSILTKPGMPRIIFGKHWRISAIHLKKVGGQTTPIIF